MKKTLGFLLATVFVFLQTGSLSAATRSFTMTASIPSATGVSLAVYGPGGAMSSDATLLNFGPLTFDTTNNVWMPVGNFMIVTSPVSGSGSVDTTVSYSEGHNPNGASGKGLGWHSFAWFRMFVPRGNQSVEIDLPAHGPRKLLKDVNNEHIPTSEMGIGTSLVLYLTLATGAASDPAGSVPFTNLDAAGTYDGTFIITATAF